MTLSFNLLRSRVLDDQWVWGTLGVCVCTRVYAHACMGTHVILVSFLPILSSGEFFGYSPSYPMPPRAPSSEVTSPWLLRGADCGVTYTV